MSHICIGVPLSTVKLLIKQKYFDKANAKWFEETSCSSTRQTWPSLSARRSRTLIKLNVNSIYQTVSILTGHCLFGRHAARLGVPHNDYCRSCGCAEEEETVLHLMCQCPALARSRSLLLGSPFLSSLSELSSIDLLNIARFIKKSKWLSSV